MPNRPWTTEARATIALAWPIALTNLSQMALLVTDAIMLGHHSPQALAASTLGANLYWLLFPIPFGIAHAAAPMLAQARGRKLHHLRDMRRTVRQGFWACTAAAVPAWLVLWHSGALLVLIGQDAALSAQAQEYGRALMWGMLPFAWFMVLRGFIAALERPAMAMWVATAAISFNALADYVLIFGHWGFPELGIAGAGWASTLSNVLMLLGLAALIARDRRMRRFRLLGRFWRHDFPRLRELYRLGLPISAALLFETGVFAVAAFMMGAFGAPALAAHAVAIQTAAATFMVPMGLSQAATARVGLAVGAGNLLGAMRAGWTAIALAAGFMALMALLLLTLPELVAGLFLDETNPESAAVIAQARVLLMLAGLFQVFDGVQAVAAGALRGLKDTRVPMLLAGLGYWGIGIPAAAFLAFTVGLQGPGLWAGLVLGLAVVSVLMTARWARLSRAAA
jgi:MATE family multidrug resistance protein